jgi:hypothetical protein
MTRHWLIALKVSTPLGQIFDHNQPLSSDSALGTPLLNAVKQHWCEMLQREGHCVDVSRCVIYAVIPLEEP